MDYLQIVLRWTLNSWHRHVKRGSWYFSWRAVPARCGRHSWEVWSNLVPAWSIKQTCLLASGQELWWSGDNFWWFGDPFTNPPKGKVCSAEDDQERHPAWVPLAIDIHDTGDLGSTWYFCPVCPILSTVGLSFPLWRKNWASCTLPEKRSELLLSWYPVYYIFPKNWEVCGVTEIRSLTEAVLTDSTLTLALLMAATPSSRC